VADASWCLSFNVMPEPIISHVPRHRQGRGVESY
jgi:hypothetical protein